MRKLNRREGRGLRSKLVACVAAIAMLATSVAAGTAVATELTTNDTESQTSGQVADAQMEPAADAVDASGDAVDVVKPSSDDARSADPVAQDDGSSTYTVDVPVGQGDTAGTLGVEVTVPSGALPDGVALVAGAVEDADAVESTLAGAGVEYDGLLAVDVRFEDADGNEVEPDGNVDVKFEMPQAALGDDVDASTLAVQHLAEDENGDVTNVDAVADAGDATQGTVETAGDKATADFTVDSFSKFTITWNNGSWKYFNVTVHYVDENGNEIDGSKSSSVNIGSGKTVSFEDYATSPLTVDGNQYEYQQAHYSSFNGDVVTTVVGSQSGSSSSSKRTYTITFNNDSKKVDSLNCRPEDRKNKHQAHTADVYLVYKQTSTSGEGGSGTSGGTGTGGSTTTKNATVQTGKTAVLRDDGNYNLTLSISGDRGSSSHPTPVDILFIVDRSASMNYKLDEEKEAGKRDTSRMDAVEDAVNTLVTTVEGNGGIDAHYSVVGFAGSKYYKGSNYTDYGTTVALDWTDNGQDAISAVEDLQLGGGTNYQQAIHTGKDQLSNTSHRSNATTYVIFISDGIPTYRGVDVTNTAGNQYSDSENGHGNGQNDLKGYNIDAAAEEIESMTCDYFYAIGMGPQFGTDKWGRDLQGTTNLKSLANAVNATTSKGGNNVFSASNTTDLQNAFNRITSSITFFAAKDVTITDPLSWYADLVLMNNAPQFTVSVTNGTQTWSETVAPDESVTFYDKDNKAQTATPRVSDDNRTIYLDLPANYQLEEGYTYSISTVITPNSEATLYYSSHGNSYPTGMMGGENTGTHSGDSGFWSNDNDNAKVTYTANGESGSENFPKPVIQVDESSPAEYGTAQHLDLQKVLKNGDLESGEFSFKLENVTGSVPSSFKDDDGQTIGVGDPLDVTFHAYSAEGEGKPALDDNGHPLSSVTVSNGNTINDSAVDPNNPYGLFDFGEITFSAPGVYTVKVSEAIPKKGEEGYRPGISYDHRAVYVQYLI